MKKKLSCALAAGLTIFFFAACDSNTYADYASMEKSQLQGSMLAPPDTLAKLQDYTDFAVRGILQSDQNRSMILLRRIWGWTILFPDLPYLVYR